MPKKFGSIDFNALLEQITNDMTDAIRDLPEEEKEAMLAKWKRILAKHEGDSKESSGDLWRIFTNDSGKCILTKNYIMFDDYKITINDIISASPIGGRKLSFSTIS